MPLHCLCISLDHGPRLWLQSWRTAEPQAAVAVLQPQDVVKQQKFIEILHPQVPFEACCSIAQERMKWLWCVACKASRHLKGQWAPLPQCPEDFKLVFNPLQRRSWPGWEQEKHSDWIQITLSMCDICDARREA